jgi:hypothetical protein
LSSVPFVKDPSWPVAEGFIERIFLTVQNTPKQNCKPFLTHSTGELKEPLLELKIKDNVDLAGLSPLSEILKDNTFWLETL